MLRHWCVQKNCVCVGLAPDFLQPGLSCLGLGPVGEDSLHHGWHDSCLLTPLITAHLGARTRTNKSSPKQMPLPKASPLEQIILLLLQCVYVHACLYMCESIRIEWMNMYNAAQEHSLKIQMLSPCSINISYFSSQYTVVLAWTGYLPKTMVVSWSPLWK